MNRSRRILIRWEKRVSGRQCPTRAPAFHELRWCTPVQAEELGMSTAMQKALDAALGAGVLEKL